MHVGRHEYCVLCSKLVITFWSLYVLLFSLFSGRPNVSFLRRSLQTAACFHLRCSLADSVIFASLVFYGWNSIYITQVYVDPRPSDCDARRWPLLLSGAGRYRSIAQPQPLIVTSYRSTGQSDGRTDTNPTLSRRLCINCSRSGQHQQAEPTANISAWARLSMYTTQSLQYYWYLGNLVATLWERTRGRPTHYANEQSIRLFVGRIQVCEVICNKNLQLSKLPSMRSPIAAISFFLL